MIRVSVHSHMLVHVEMTEIAFDEKEKHLRVVCNVLWKMHNFCAFTSELSSCTLLRL